MRILYICADFGIPVLGFKGASVHVRELTDALIDLDHEVIVVTPNVGAGNTAQARIMHVPAPHLPPARMPSQQGDVTVPNKQLEREVRELRYNAELLRVTQRLAVKWQPELIYERYALYGLAGGALARRLGLPYLLEVNAPLRSERRRGRGLVLDGLARWCERRIFSSAGHVLCVSQALADYVIERGGQPGRVHVLPNAVDTSKFHPESRNVALRTALGFDDGHVVVGFVGSLKPWHGVEHLVEAFTVARLQAPQLRLLIVGDGPARPSVERMVVEGNLTGTVRLIGNVAHAEVPRYLAAMDVAAAPYLNAPDFYFSPLKVFEYMAAGRAVIAPRLGQIPDLVRQGTTGLLYAPGDTAALIEGLVVLTECEGLRAQLGACAAEEMRAHHSWQATARQILTLGEELRPINQ